MAFKTDVCLQIAVFYGIGLGMGHVAVCANQVLRLMGTAFPVDTSGIAVAVGTDRDAISSG
jgi:hypothetical protein